MCSSLQDYITTAGRECGGVRYAILIHKWCHPHTDHEYCQDDYLFLYCALEAYITNNGTTIPSPVDLEQWRNGFQLNGCVRVSKVYTDSVGESVSKVWDSVGMAESFRIPPDGMESDALLKNENGDSSHIS